MFCKSLPVQTSPEAPVQKNAAAGGSTQTILRQGPSLAARQLLCLHGAEEMGQPREMGSPSPENTLGVSSDLQKQARKRRRGKEERRGQANTTHAALLTWKS